MGEDDVMPPSYLFPEDLALFFLELLLPLPELEAAAAPTSSEEGGGEEGSGGALAFLLPPPRPPPLLLLLPLAAFPFALSWVPSPFLTMIHKL